MCIIRELGGSREAFSKEPRSPTGTGVTMATDAAAGGVAMAARINYRTKMTSLKQAIETEHDNFSTHMKTCFQALGDVLDALHAMRKAPSPPPKQPSTDPQEPASNKNKNKTPLQAIVSSSKTSQPPKHQPLSPSPHHGGPGQALLTVAWQSGLSFQPFWSRSLKMIRPNT